MLYVFCVECRDKMPRNKGYNAYSVVTTHGKEPRVAFAFARQPWAIRSTTLTALRSYNIRNGGFIHWNNGTIPTALRRYNIQNCEIHPLEYWHNIYSVARCGHLYCDLHPLEYRHNAYGFACWQHSQYRLSSFEKHEHLC